MVEAKGGGEEGKSPLYQPAERHNYLAKRGSVPGMNALKISKKSLFLAKSRHYAAGVLRPFGPSQFGSDCNPMTNGALNNKGPGIIFATGNRGTSQIAANIMFFATKGTCRWA